MNMTNRLSHGLKSTMESNQIMTLSVLLYEKHCEKWNGSPPTHHAPKGRPIPPPLKRRGLSGPFTVINIQSRQLLLMTLFFVGTPHCPVQFSPGNVAHCLKWKDRNNGHYYHRRRCSRYSLSYLAYPGRLGCHESH